MAGGYLRGPHIHARVQSITGFFPKSDPEPKRRACEIRLRAERKAGQLRKAMEKAKAGRPKKNRSCDTRDLQPSKTLTDLGISYDHC